MWGARRVDKHSSSPLVLAIGKTKIAHVSMSVLGHHSLIVATRLINPIRSLS